MIRRTLPAIASLFLAFGALAASGASAQEAPRTPNPTSHGNPTCDGVKQDRAACLREAGAAKQEARRNGLTSANPASYENNALARCQLQPVAERADCEARIVGSGAGRTTVEGSVMGGGVIRETVTPIPAPAR